MKKTAILATAIAAVLAAPLATAAKHEGKGPHVTVYGLVHNSVDSIDVTGGNKNIQVNDHSSRLGFKGSEDLGNGLKATFQIEFGVITDGDTGSIQGSTTRQGPLGTDTRNTYVGLAGSFGEVRIGRHDSPAKVAFYAAGNEHLGDSVIDLNGSHGFAENRLDDVIAYISPNMNGLTAAVALVPGEGSGTAGNPGDGFADGTSVGIMYKSGPIKAGLGILDGADVLGVSDASVTNIGGSYNMGDITVGLQYQTREIPGVEATIYALVGKFNIGDNAIIASFGNSERDAGAGGTTDGDVMNLAFKRGFSKRTTGYVAYSSVDTGAAAQGNNLSTIGTATETTALSLGIVHKF